MKQVILLSILFTAILITTVQAEQNEKKNPVIPIKAQSFALEQIKLLNGPFKDNMLRNKKYLLDLEPDRFLFTFKLTAGLPTSAQPYGGWEKPNGELRGHSMGHYLTALSLTYASTGEKEFKRRVEYIVTELAKSQEAMPSKGYNNGFLSAYPESFFDRVDACKPVWAPYYTLHKILAGLLD
ncbi:MAG: glycoside hydrolase family 127 protein, partial [Kiritimatiellae bacterium]|nr:glycoside hydrolase family 127 protein [Kiritimatiellia bacterium]